MARCSKEMVQSLSGQCFSCCSVASASQRVVAGQSSCRWSTDYQIGQQFVASGATSATSTAHFGMILQELVRVLRGARAALAEPSQDVYVAARQFQTNKLLGYPGRRPDAARRPLSKIGCSLSRRLKVYHLVEQCIPAKPGEEPDDRPAKPGARSASSVRLHSLYEHHYHGCQRG